MKASDLLDYLNNQTTISSLLKSLEGEVITYIKQIDKIGSVVAIVFDEDQRMAIKISDVKKLLQDMHQIQFEPEYLSYICDCLTLAKNVEYENDKIEDLIWEFADPEINGYKTQTEIQTVLNAL